MLSYELGHLHAVAELFKKHERRDPKEVVGDKLPVAIPFESLVHSLRTVIGVALTQGMRGLGVLLRFVGLLFKRSAKVLELAYDITIVVPLMLERWAVAWRSGASVEADDVALSKSRRAA